ncbi:PEP-CTERM sorting domain-containing protein [Roseobacter sinensis]|uniref:PEP-CTERM sorting domain-containing protein n=1 Tax=Roseobacter sinensis TaxID=2931391 RepID=A0ABT3BEZ7_9RHOB|nr:PEP-CTERM sorting domain-containing protein [Roseobacter sp. WL0113]MCV3272128.1 PEP-CTERM sorting domain-containing protein [Roseobacter sp. WL0113]
MKLLHALVAGLLLLAPLSVQAATILVYEADGEGVVTDGATTGFFGDFFDLDADDIDIAASADTTTGDLDASLLVSTLSGATLLESTTVVSSSLTINDPNDDGSPSEDFFTIVFGNLSGDDTGLFGDVATVVFSFFEETEQDGLYAPVNAQVFSDLTPIPAPASLPLLAAGLGGLLALRRHKMR